MRYAHAPLHSAGKYMDVCAMLTQLEQVIRQTVGNIIQSPHLPGRQQDEQLQQLHQ